MGIFAQRQHQAHDHVSAIVVRPNTPSQATRQTHPLLALPRTIGNRAVQRLLQADGEERDAGVISATSVDRVHLLLGQRLFDGKSRGGDKKPETKRPEKTHTEPEKLPDRGPCDVKCGIPGGPYGNTECELDLKSGLLTGKVTKEVFDKNPCTQPCVEVHEGVHAKKIAPICTAAKKCLDAAGSDDRKQGKCLDTFEADMNALTFSTECAAYPAEEACLGQRAKKAECKSAEGKKRWDEQIKMVACYKECFCTK